MHNIRILFVLLQQKSKTIMADDMKEKYINPYTDFGFKKLFGTDIFKYTDVERKQYEEVTKNFGEYLSWQYANL